MRWGAAVLVAAALLALGGCSGRRTEPRFTPIVYSPIGEPLAPERSTRQQCLDAVAGWFARVDINRDGAVDRGELMRDAARLFEAMDRDGDGTITPAELAEQRAPFRTAVREKPRQAEEPRPGRGRVREEPPPASGRSDRTDPVMSADVNFDIRVTRAEWAAHVDKRLRRLDADRNGRLSLEEAQAVCDEEE
jgi:Ca2+-binding EF-hand superfamily protein